MSDFRHRGIPGVQHRYVSVVRRGSNGVPSSKGSWESLLCALLSVPRAHTWPQHPSLCSFTSGNHQFQKFKIVHGLGIRTVLLEMKTVCIHVYACVSLHVCAHLCISKSKNVFLDMQNVHSIKTVHLLPAVLQESIF